MSTFEIDKSSIIEEFFATDTGKDKPWPAGAFDYQLSFHEYSRTETDQLCEWLGENCTKNFIIMRNESQIIAGGYSDNMAAWKKRHHKSYKRDLISEITVRLDESDIFLFRMVWIQ
jgi:hypothetical protein